MTYITLILTVAFIHFLAVISPGPDFIMITRNTIVYSRKTGIYSAIGLALGILLHVTYSLIGLGLLIANSIILFNIFKFAAAIYLGYLGFKALTSRSKDVIASPHEAHHKHDLSKLAAIRMGFLTNATNPKPILLFVSVFTLVISPQTPFIIKTIMGLEMSLATFAWFALVSLIFSHHLLKNQLNKIQHIAEKVMGGILILLGIRLAFETNK